MTQLFYLEILPPISPIPLPPRKQLSRMCEFIKPKKLTFENEMGLSSKPQIKPLLSRKVEQPTKLQIDKMKNEFSKPYVSPVKIKTEYQNVEEVKTNFVSDEKVAVELGLTTTLRALNLPTKLTFEMPKNGSSNVERKSLYKVLLQRLLKVWINR